MRQVFNKSDAKKKEKEFLRKMKQLEKKKKHKTSKQVGVSI